jgi:hypothetical protein
VPDRELVEDLACRLGEQVVDGLRVVVEGGHGRQDGRAGQGDGLHVADVDEVQGRLPGDQDELPAFFEAHVGGAGDEVAAVARGDRRQGLHRAGHDAGAKAHVSSFIESLALRPLDVGDLKMAHWLEGADLLMVAPGVGKAVEDSNFWLGINTLG